MPHDDKSCTFYGWRFFSDDLPGGDRDQIGVNTIDFDGQAEGPDYESKQRAPGDWEAQAGQRPIAIHALEHRASTDAGVTLLRQMLRQAVREEKPSAWPPESKIGARAPRVSQGAAARWTQDANEGLPAADIGLDVGSRGLAARAQRAILGNVVVP